MRKFNLEEAKAGKPVCTRDEMKVRIVCFDAKSIDNDFPILALVDYGDGELDFRYNIDGRIYKEESIAAEEDPTDLFMAPEHHIGWVNIYNTHDGNKVITGPYETEKEAVQAKFGDEVVTTKIEWDD